MKTATRERPQRTILVQEEEDEGVDDGDEDTSPQGDPRRHTTSTSKSSYSKALRPHFESVHLPLERRLNAMAHPMTSCMSEPMMASSTISHRMIRGTWTDDTGKCQVMLGAMVGISRPLPLRLWPHLIRFLSRAYLVPIFFKINIIRTSENGTGIMSISEKVITTTLLTHTYLKMLTRSAAPFARQWVFYYWHHFDPLETWAVGLK